MVELNPVKQESYQYSTLVFLDVTKTYQPLAKRNQVFASLSVGGGGVGGFFPRQNFPSDGNQRFHYFDKRDCYK